MWKPEQRTSNQHRQKSRAEIDAIADEKAQEARILEKVQPILQPVWSFFVALCHALQEGENELTAIDAYWMGLVNKVIGEALPTSRWFAEYEPDAQTQQPAQEPHNAGTEREHPNELAEKTAILEEVLT
jgi:hypothetical protein